MRKTAITILLTLAGIAGYAQTAYDGLLFSENNYEGTARSVAMGMHSPLLAETSVPSR